MCKKKLFACLFVITLSLMPPAESTWAEETLKKMSLNEKVGQLFMVGVSSLDSEEQSPGQTGIYFYGKEIDNLIKNYCIGGLIFFKGTPEKQVSFINHVQAISTIPLLIGQDSISANLTDTINFPKNMTLGAIVDDNIIYDLGRELGKQYKTVGIHINFAPNIDISTNPKNPIVGTRSFGSFKENVTKKGTLFFKGLQDEGIIACAKHFPGHGDTDVDSHLDLPIINHSQERLYAEELYPFKSLIDAGVKSIMPAHLSIPSIDESNMPASLSKKIVTNLLKKKLGFKGLIITDGMNMKGIMNTFNPQQAALLAILAGNDILLCPLEVKKSIEYITKSVEEGIISETKLNRRVIKILKIKEELQLHENKFVNTENIHKNLHSPEAIILKKQLYKKAITLINNEEQIFPFPDIDSSNTIIVDVGETLSTEKDFEHLFVPVNCNENEVFDCIKKLQQYENIIIRIFKVNEPQNVFGMIKPIESTLKTFFNLLKEVNKRIVFMLCTSAYALPFLPNFPTVIAYEKDSFAIDAAMNVLAGKFQAEGYLPIIKTT
jgi:beta-N-acetylhexosaminidase